jgi:transcriptional regulator with XRE-family HTH domain
MNYFQKNLEFLMRRQGETQESVAEFAEVTQPSVSNWLLDTTPGTAQLEKLARLFEVTLDDLVNHELPYRKHIEALTEIERELKELKLIWDNVTSRLRQLSTQSADKREYSAAVQNDWMASGIEYCSDELAKVLDAYFPGAQPDVTAIINP